MLSYDNRPLTKHVHFSHAEPEQAAQMMGSNAPPPPRREYSSSNVSYNTKPTPAPAQGGARDDRYSGRSNQRYQSNSSYGSGQGPLPQQSYSDFGRAGSPRYGQNQGGYGGPSDPVPPPRSNTNNFGTSSPLPSSYGNGPPPSGYHNRPPIPSHQRPPRTVPPPPRDSSDVARLQHLFGQVDLDGNKEISESELQNALVNGDYTPFDPHTIKMMIRMFDTSHHGTLDFKQFQQLWAYLSDWRDLFNLFDKDHSGTISLDEFVIAVKKFGYTLSPHFIQLLFSTYARASVIRKDGQREPVLSFDLFVQAFISLKRMTDVFKGYDTDRDGYITLSFEEYLTEILLQW